eukprot:m.934955 g.934955  ORF g.934955 m.934955 type:complete len:431 (+) comp23802_c0_seq3:395-1687(+)
MGCASSKKVGVVEQPGSRSPKASGQTKCIADSDYGNDNNIHTANDASNGHQVSTTVRIAPTPQPTGQSTGSTKVEGENHSVAATTNSYEPRKLHCVSEELGSLSSEAIEETECTADTDNGDTTEEASNGQQPPSTAQTPLASLPTGQSTESNEVVERNHPVTVTTIRYEPGILQRVSEHLDSGQPVLLPLPSPLPYAIIGRSPEVVNEVKGRLDEQAVARIISSFDEVEPSLTTMVARAREAAIRYLETERMTVLLPVRKKKGPQNKISRSPDFSGTQNRKQLPQGGRFHQPSETVRRESLKMDVCANPAGFGFALCHQSVPLRGTGLTSQDNPLYGSSANVHGKSYQQSFVKIVEQFKSNKTEVPFHLLALDAEHMRDVENPHESTTMVEISRGGTVRRTREGIHDHPLYAEKCSWRLTSEEVERWKMC